MENNKFHWTKQVNGFSIKTFLGLALSLVILATVGTYVYLEKFTKKETIEVQKKQQENNEQQVLDKPTPKIFISSNKERYFFKGSGGLMAQASTDEPVVYVGGYYLPNNRVEVSVYEADEQGLLDYLTHDKESNQIRRDVDISRFRLIKKMEHEIKIGDHDGSRLLLPLSEVGIYFLQIQQGSTTANVFIVRSNMGVIVKEGDNEFIFWAQNFKTGRSLNEGSLSIYNLENNIKEIEAATFDGEGVARTKLVAEADIALIRNAGDKAIVPINLTYLNNYYNYKYKFFHPKIRRTKYFIFTDRPIYRPGETVYFKSILRDDDDARYTIPIGQAKVEVYKVDVHDSLIFEKNYNISERGTVSGEFKLPTDSKTGNYKLVVKTPIKSKDEEAQFGEYYYDENWVWFDVEFFNKPEYFVSVDAQKTMLVSGDNLSFTIRGNYFSGQPLANQKVKYRIYSGDYYNYDFYESLTDSLNSVSNDYRYGYWGGNVLTSGEVTLNQNGVAEIDLETKLSTKIYRNQVFSIEAEFDDGSGNPAFSRKNILVFRGEYDIYRNSSDYLYSVRINAPLSLPIILVTHHNTSVSGISLTAKIHRTNWVRHQDPNQDNPTYEKEEEDLPAIKTTTDGQGKTTIIFTPTKVGSYEILVEGNDALGNTIRKEFHYYAIDENYPFYLDDRDNKLMIRADKQKYLPTDTATLTITSTIPDRDVFLSLERGRVNRFQIVKMSGTTANVDVPLENTDMPNIYAKISSFSRSILDRESTNLVVSPESKKLTVKITPNSKTLAPGDNVTINIETTDVGGNPVPADVTVWAVDKAIFELVDNNLKNIFETFWKEQANSTEENHSLQTILMDDAEMGGGCFAAGTQVLMADGSAKAIENVKAGDYVLTKENDKSSKLVRGKVIGTHKATVAGYLIINENLRVTTNHKLWVNNSWKEASSVQIGDKLTDFKGNTIDVSSVEWVEGKFTVYNLEIDKYHTYFANEVWVHNQKGGGRTVFKDTAYWNPAVHTDESGRAQVSFKLPDNLTTWVIAAVGDTIDTKVGQSTNEIMVTKDVIVRPILPNILREGDEIVLSALVQNFTEKDHTFDVDLKFDAGEVISATHSGVFVKAKEMQQVSWKVLPKKDNDRAKLTFSARSQDDKTATDTVVEEIPVRAFGFWEQRAETGYESTSFFIKLAADSHSEKSNITLSLAPNILGTLPSAMNYLVDYPYGCVEQTTSRFVPAVIAKTNSDLFANALNDKDIDDIITKGIIRLARLQRNDGGWSWWYSGKSNLFVTAYVTEYLLQAKNAGIKVDNTILNDVLGFLEQKNNDNNSGKQLVEKLERDEEIALNYALTLFGFKDKVKRVDNLENITPDILSLAIMTNYLNGDTNPQTNGLAKLMGMAKSQGDGVFWEAGDKNNFGSIDASTALAIRAIVTADGDRGMAVKAAKYLIRQRKTNYWSNTFATAQVIRAIVDLTKDENELSPNYTYTVTVDNKQISHGSVTNYRQLIKDIVIPAKDIKPNGSKMTITKTGDGYLYSTLLINEFRTDPRAKTSERGLKVTREYINDKGEEYSLAVGDTVIVKITVSGLDARENYGVISDELPAGLIPINQSFKNQQFTQNSYDNYPYYSDKEITENGIVISAYYFTPGVQTYTYKARVVSEGKFAIPPAVASLMYAPEIYGRSEAQTIEITKESRIIPGKMIKKTINTNKISQKQLLMILEILFVLMGPSMIILKRRGVKIAHVRQKIKNIVAHMTNRLRKNRPKPPNSSS